MDFDKTKMPYSIEDVLSCKDFDSAVIQREYKNLKDWDATELKLKKCGNRIVNKYQFPELTRCPRNTKNYQTIYDIYNNNEQDKLWEQVCKRKVKESKGKPPLKRHVWETIQINKGSVCFFQPSCAKYIYKKFGATSVLDPTAGWGGRLLGASSLDIHYMGFDTNTKLKDGYDRMIQDLDLKNVEMIYQDSLSYDFSELKYDLVLTSPPYYNLELYENMTPFESEDFFYNSFLIPLMNKCFQYLQEGGNMCFNVSPDMYIKLINLGYDECTEKVPLKQSSKSSKQRQDYIYIWNKPCV